MRLLRALARLSPVAGRDDPDLDRALGFLGANATGALVAEAACGTLALAVLAALAVAVVAPPAVAPTAAAAVVAAGAGVAYAVYRAPRWLATARRVRALGDAPALVARAALRLHVSPAPEEAAAFAARGDGPLAQSLRDHVRRARGTPESGWTGFADEWGDWNPQLRRAVSLLRAAADAPPGDRERVLDRALSVVLDGTRDRAAAFASSLHGPATAVYAFGVVLPLALVGVLPAARAAGVPVSPLAVAVALDAVLPAVLVAAGAHLLARRPAAFPPVAVPRDHPDMPDRSWPPVAVGLVAASVAWVAVGALAPGWTRWVSAPGAGVGVALAWWARPVVAIREDVRAVESGLADALALAGGRLREGDPPEAAVAHVGDALQGATGDAFADAARVQRQLRLDARAAFLGDHGALRWIPSPRVRAAAELLSLAAREGDRGGRVLVELADHLDELAAVERDARRSLSRITGTLRTTAALFAPLVGGVTVALAARMRDLRLPGAADPMPAAALGLAVGGYVLWLAVLLPALAVGLERGLDRAAVAAQAGTALASASVAYPAAVAGAGLLV